MAEGKEIDVGFYVTRKGKVPFKKWLLKLKDRDARGRILLRIARLRSGNFGDAKSVGKGVSEIRVDYGPGYRLYFGRAGEALVLLLCGGDKDTQAADIKMAKEYWEEYKSRTGAEAEE